MSALRRCLIALTLTLSQRERGACLDGLDRSFRHAVRWLSVWLLPLLVDVARAAEEAHHESGAEHHPAGIPWGTLGLTTVNFLLFCYVIARFVMPAVRGWLRERHQRIVGDLEAAAKAKAEALRLRDDWQRRIDQLGETAAKMRTQARLDAERERDRILAAAHKSAETIRKDAERTAAYQIRRTEEQLRAELAKAALQQVEEQVRSKWTAEDQTRFVADFLAQVQS